VVELKDHDPSDWQAAFELASSEREKIQTGIYFQNEEIPAYHEQVDQLESKTLIAQWQDRVDIGAVIKDYV
jgi:hypothetical protein